MKFWKVIYMSETKQFAKLNLTAFYCPKTSVAEALLTFICNYLDFPFLLKDYFSTIDFFRIVVKHKSFENQNINFYYSILKL